MAHEAFFADPSPQRNSILNVLPLVALRAFLPSDYVPVSFNMLIHFNYNGKAYVAPNLNDPEILSHHHVSEYFMV